MTDAPVAQELDAGALRRPCRVEELGFASTRDVSPLDGTVGQTRAHAAIAFALDAETVGHNIFVTGPPGTGKRTSVEAHLHDHARRRPAASDLVYVHNFRDPRRPIAIELPSSTARALAADMRAFLEDARRDLAAAFESDVYSRRRRELVEPIEREQEAALSELQDEGRARGIVLELTPTGLMTVPLRDGHPITPSEFGQLSEAERAGYQHRLEELGPRIQAFMTRIRTLQRQGRERLRDLDREIGLFAVGHLIEELLERHTSTPRLAKWLSAVAEDVTENLSQFRSEGTNSGGDDAQSLLAAIGSGSQTSFSRYEVNVFVSHDADAGAPVVLESNPTYPNLFGRIEHQGVLGGGFVTDHRMLRPGAVHRANGGYLMLPAAEVLAQPLVWLKLKDVLRTGRIRLENPAEEYALIPTTTLNPETVELDLKVVLVGAPYLYHLAYTLDEDIRKLFRVKAEFDWRVPWDEDGVRGYAAFLSSHVRTAGLRHFDAAAVARIVEYGARLADDRDWLSTSFVEVAGLAAEASHWAAQDGSDHVDAAHVERALEEKVQRSNLIEQRLLEMVAEGALMLDFEGARVGQVNGLSVLDVGDYSFGRPVRITATAGPGRGALLSIERETELSGHIHDKGFLTLSGYLRDRYGGDRRIALGATLTFEQSYDRIDGDSAASAELYALLSELAGAPIRQDIAVTGSVNQHGELQAIGGVNEKVEGFFRACSLNALTGSQGVIVPASNVRNLMLSPEVVDAVRAGRFHVWSARTIEQGIELLTGIPAGRRGDDGRFPEGTIHARVEERLERWAKLDEGDRDGAGGPEGVATDRPRA
jgi:predicted ATP-dependent protease